MEFGTPKGKKLSSNQPFSGATDDGSEILYHLLSKRPYEKLYILHINWLAGFLNHQQSVSFREVNTLGIQSPSENEGRPLLILWRSVIGIP